MKYLLYIIVFCFLARLNLSIDTEPLKIASPIPWTGQWPAGPYLGSASLLGLREAQRRGWLGNRNFTWKFYDTKCQARPGLGGAADIWAEMGGVDAYIGGGCSVVCEPIGLLAAYYNVPQISFSCGSSTLSNKYNYPTFSRTVSDVTMIGPIYEKFIKYFNWTRVALITSTDNVMQDGCNAISSQLDSIGVQTFFHSFTSVMEGSEVDQENLAKLKENVAMLPEEARVVFLCMYDDDYYHFMMSAHELGLLNPEYVYIMSTFAPSDDFFNRPMARELMEGFISLEWIAPSGSKWDAFTSEVRTTLYTDPLFEGYDKLRPDEEVSVFAGMLHDAALVWAYALNRTVEAGGSPTDGVAITNNIFNSQIEGITGTVAINEKGNRKDNNKFQIWNDDKWVTMFHYYGATDTLEVVDLESVKWSGGMSSPPTGEPEGGWDNELGNPITKDRKGNC